MFVLLRHLHQLKRSIARPRPPAAAAGAAPRHRRDPATGAEHEAHRRRQPLLRPAAVRPGTNVGARRATPMFCSSPERSPPDGRAPAHPATTRCPHRDWSPASAIARSAATCRREQCSGLARWTSAPVDIRIPGAHQRRQQIAEHLLAAIIRVLRCRRRRPGAIPVAAWLRKRGGRSSSGAGQASELVADLPQHTRGAPRRRSRAPRRAATAVDDAEDPAPELGLGDQDLDRIGRGAVDADRPRGRA